MSQKILLGDSSFSGNNNFYGIKRGWNGGFDEMISQMLMTKKIITWQKTIEIKKKVNEINFTFLACFFKFWLMN